MVKLTVNGVALEVPENTTLLEAIMILLMEKKLIHI